MAPSPVRKIIHVDMDAFYASVEMRDRPELRGRPLIVGGRPEGRGVVAAASYEARRYGIRSAMPAARAQRLCPELVILPPDFAKYREVSGQIRGIFHRYTHLVEPLSLDEAYLDVTEPLRPIPSATWIAREIKAAIREETGLTASAGVAPNKFLAKIASDEKKPDGLFVIRPQDVAAFVRTLSVAKVPGIGKATQARLEAMGIATCADLQQVPLARLEQVFGKRGGWFHRIAQGIDERAVEPSRPRKSISLEDTFARDEAEPAWLEAKLEELVGRLAERMQRAQTRGRTVTLKVRFADFRTITRSRTLPAPTDDGTAILDVGRELLAAAVPAGSALRLLGVGLSNLEGEEPPGHTDQLGFPWAAEGETEAPATQGDCPEAAIRGLEKQTSLTVAFVAQGSCDAPCPELRRSPHAGSVRRPRER